MIKAFLIAVCASSFCLAQLPKSGDKTATAEYGVGDKIVSISTNPAGPVSATVFLTNPATLGRVNCPNGPLGSTPDTCISPSGAAVTVTVKADSNGISSIGMLSGTTILVDPSKPVTRLLPGGPSATGNPFMTADPISTASGGLDAGPFVDLSLGGPLPLVLRRFYFSGLGTAFGQNAIGYNWTTNFDPYLGVSGNFATVGLEGGGAVSFQASGTTFKPIYASRFAYQLVKLATGFRFMNPENNLIYNFDASGLLTKIEDRNGNALTITRSIQGVTLVADGLGRTLTFSYGGSAQPSLTRVQDQTGRAISFTHDGSLNLTSITDANGNTTTYSYTGALLGKTVRPRGNSPYTQVFDPTSGAVIRQADSAGNNTVLSYITGGKPGVTTLKDPLGRTTTYNYGDSTLANLTSVVDAAGNTSATTYDSASRPTTFTDRLGNKSSITYDSASGYPASSTDAVSNTTTWTYQAQAQGDFTFYNLAKIGYADGTSKTFTYDAAGNILTETDGAGKKTTYTYNSRGQVLTKTNPAGGVTTTAYNTDGTIATVKSQAGDVTTYSYDTLMRLSKIQYADGTSKAFTRDALDHILTITDERGKATKFGYDVNNNLQSTTDALNKTSQVAYDTDDLVASTLDALGNQTQFQYDPLGSLAGVTAATGELTTLNYDQLERLQSVADSAGKGPSFTYDPEGRLATVGNAFGDTTKVQADNKGRATQVTTPLGENISLSYDGLDRITSVKDALGRQGSATYESRGLPASITSPGGIAASFAWGDLPLLNSVTDPNGNVWPVTRDTQGRITASTDPLGHAVKYTYDSRDRVSTVTSPVDSSQLTYDAAGNLTQAKYSDNTTLTYSYDDANRLTGGTGLSLSYDANGRIIGSNGIAITRDAAGRIATITYAPGKTVTYTYDGRGLLSRISDWTSGGAFFNFDDAHRLISERRSNGVISNYLYDKDGRIRSISDSENIISLASMSFTRDAVGRVTATSRFLPQEVLVPASPTSSLNYDAANQIANSTYDARGRLTADSAGNAYHWNAASRLTSYTRPEGTVTSTYDALGQRISRTAVDGTTRNYVLNYATGLPSLAIVQSVVQSTATDVRYYVYTPEGLLLYGVDAATGAHRYYSFDETGSTTLLTDELGLVQDSYGITSYGDVVTPAYYNLEENPFTWQGRYGVMQEPGTKLYYAHFRYYDAGTARFLSRDPMLSPAPKEVNPYPYAAGNPVANADPTGLKAQPIVPPVSVEGLWTLQRAAVETAAREEETNRRLKAEFAAQSGKSLEDALRTGFAPLPIPVTCAPAISIVGDLVPLGPQLGPIAEQPLLQVPVVH
jgi:RHS repeat-associated protein